MNENWNILFIGPFIEVLVSILGDQGSLGTRSISIMASSLVFAIILEVVNVNVSNLFYEAHKGNISVDNLNVKRTLPELFNTAFTLGVMYLKILLWTLLLFVPGVIKTYEYIFVPFILAENPGIDYKDALMESQRLTEGNKMDIFNTHLSLWWIFILSTIALAIIDLTPFKIISSLVLVPIMAYEHSLNAKWYIKLKEEN